VKLLFQYIWITNFLSYRGDHEFNFDDFQIGMHFIRGRNETNKRLDSNDAGKSSLLGALSWALYGKTPAGQKNQEVKPWSGETNTSVVVGIKIDDKKHKIERSIGPNALKIDEKTCNQEAIDNLLRLNYEVFLHTVLLGQGKPLFFDLEPKAKMDLFGTVLDLDRWDRRSKLASEKTAELENEHITLSSDLRSTNMSLDGVVKNFDAVSEKSKSWSSDQQNKIDDAKSSLEKSRKEYERVRKIREDADLKYDGAEVELKALRDEAEKLSIEVLELTKKADLVGYEVLKRDHDRLTDDLRKFGKGNDCPTCGQPIKGTNFHKHKAKLLNQIADLSDKMAPIKKQIDQTQAKVNAKAELLIKQREHMKKFEKKSEEAEHTSRIAKTDEARLEASIGSLKALLKSLDDETNPYREQISQLRRQKSQLEGKLKDIDKSMSSIENRIGHTKFWVKGFKDIKLYIINDVVHELEITTNAMLPDVGLDGWKVKYDVERETKSGNVQRSLNVAIASPGSPVAVPWHSWGGGVGQRLRLISALALSEVLLNHAGVQPDLEILDEPTRSLSVPGVRDLCEYLAWRADNLGKVALLIDHKAIESSRFSSVITIVKDKNGSHIELPS